MEQQYTYNEPPADEVFQALRVERAAKKSFAFVALSAALLIAIAYAASYLLIALLTVTGLANTPFIQQNLASVNILLSTVPMYLIALPICYLVLKRTPTFPIEKQTMTVKQIVGMYLVCSFFSLVGAQISNVVTSFLSALLGYMPSYDVQDMLLQTPMWLSILLSGIIGPIAEELFFRKLMIDRLGAYGEIPAILFSSMLFALGHGNFFQVFFTFLIGVVLGYIYVKTGKLIYPIIIHIANNLFATVVSVPLMKFLNTFEELFGSLDPSAMPSDEELLEMLMQPELLGGLALLLFYALFTYGTAIAGAILFFLHVRRLTFKPRLLSTVGRQSMTRAALLNWGVLAVAIVSVFQFVLSLLQ